MSETRWQPIETVKQQGWIWGFSTDGQYALSWLDADDPLNTDGAPSGWYDVWGDRHSPTHWMPLPSPPEAPDPPA